MLLEIVRVSDYIGDDGVFRRGECIYTDNPAVFEQFVIGLKVEL